MKTKHARVQCVIPGSIADEAGIEPGDAIVSINGEKVRDIFDYRFLTTSEELSLEIIKGSGEIWEVEIEKDEYEDLGMEFDSSMMDDAKSCTNKCVFCFIDQLPKGMRKTLYFKDDDSRLSFLMGNYVTLTNMKDEEIDRIIKYRMSPINVSVHTTNPDLRVMMLKNKFAGNVMDRIKKLVDQGITVNCQIVLCREINDGAELDRTISDLSELYPGVRSISVVPVGITKYREGLYSLEPFDRESSRNVVAQIEGWQAGLLDKYGSRVVYLADEFYIMSDYEIPEYDAYEDFPQIENGVGLIAQLKHEFEEQLEKASISSLTCSMMTDAGKKRTVSIATGVSAYKFIREMSDALEQKFRFIKINVYEIINEFFGENVTVAGLLTGRDFVCQLKGKDLGEELLISRSMLKADESIFLDDYTIEMIEKELDIKITPVDNSGEGFIRSVLGIKS